MVLCSTLNGQTKMWSSIYKLNTFLALLLISGLFACASVDNGSSSELKEASDAVPNTEIYLAKISFPDNKFTIGKALNITHNPGYDNQPYFLPGNNSLLYTSVKNLEAENPQSDIYAYTFESASTTQITATPESEYSPTLTPNGQAISVVRVDMDGEQRLWEFPIKTETVTNSDYRQVFPEIMRVGYHVWRNQDEAFLFLVDENLEGDEHTLVKAVRGKKDADLITTKIGRSLTIQPNNEALIFVDKTSEETWNIKRYDLEKQFSEILLSTLEGSEDLVWLDDSYLLMAKGQEIYMRTIDDEYAEWLLLADAKSMGISGDITRLAVSPDKTYIAIVVSE